jgi:hypothetical protein
MRTAVRRHPSAAGGCFAFRAIRWIDGGRTTITGVVVSQSGPDLAAAGLGAADTMGRRIAVGHRQMTRGERYVNDRSSVGRWRDAGRRTSITNLVSATSTKGILAQ